MRIDEAGHDGRSGQVHDAFCLGRVAYADTLYMPPVDEDPLSLRRVSEGVYPRGAVEGSHGARIMP